MASAAEPGPSSVGSGMLTQAAKSRSSKCPKAGTDPLAKVLTLGGRHNGVGLAMGLAGALFVHGAGAATSLHQLFELEDFAAAIYSDISTELRGVYDIEVDDPPPPQQEPPPPEEEAEEDTEEADPLEPAEEAPVPEAPPPEAAEVGEALTAEPDPDAPLDLTGDQWSMVTGPGTRFAGGASQRGGKSKDAVRDRKAKANAEPAPKRVAARPGTKAKKPKKDLSRPAGLASSASWNSCGFPAEAEMGQINYARVVLVVAVAPNGKPQRVSVVSETPAGFGFGALAQQCAYSKSFSPGLDRDGNPTTSTTPSIGVTFER